MLDFGRSKLINFQCPHYCVQLGGGKEVLRSGGIWEPGNEDRGFEKLELVLVY